MTIPDQRRVVVVEGADLLRDGLKLLLAEWGFECVGSADTAPRGATLIASTPHDVAVVDVELPVAGDGLALVRKLVERDPNRALLVLTGPADERAVMELGARGIVTKGAPTEEVHDALELLLAGRPYLDGQLGARLVNSGNHQRLLSNREREILALLAEGYTGPAIADELVISGETVRTHVQHAMEKLGARTRVHAIVLALERSEIAAPTNHQQRNADYARP
jgi:two-component system, NarL family, response regulator NreC